MIQAGDTERESERTHAGMQPRHPKHKARTHPLLAPYPFDGTARREIVGGGAASHRSVRLGQIGRRVATVYTREARITAAHPRVAARVDSAAHARAPVGWPRRSSARFEATTEGDTLQSDAGLRPSRLPGRGGGGEREDTESGEIGRGKLVGANADVHVVGDRVFLSPAEDGRTTRGEKSSFLGIS